MKKLSNLFLFVVTSLLLLSCEKEPEYPGAYPFDHVVFYGDTLITEGDSARVLFLDYNNWNQDLYPMQLWVDNEQIATISQSGYLTAKKEGTVTIHAKVMSIYGEIESRIKYTVRDFLKEYIKGHQYYLKQLGFDRNNDGTITVSEVQEIENISGYYYINSNLLINLAPFMPKLKEVKIESDTAIRNLDLSSYNYKKVTIHDKIMSIPSLVPRDENYDQYEKFFLKEFTFNNSLEHLEIYGIPGIRLLDLRQYTNLKKLIRPYDYRVNTIWLDLQVMLPKNIEEVNLIKTKIIFDDIYYNLKKIRLRYHVEDENTITEINKKYVPNLRNLHITTSTNHIDISSFQAEDLDSLFISTDTIYVSQSMYEGRYSSGKDIRALHYIIK
jgi:hypothetical protein